MKIKPNLKVRMIAGEAIVLLKDGDGRDMTKVLALNSSSLYLWKQLEGKDFTLNDVVATLVSYYDVDEAKARQDAAVWLEQMKEQGAVE